MKIATVARTIITMLIPITVISCNTERSSDTETHEITNSADPATSSLASGNINYQNEIDVTDSSETTVSSQTLSTTDLSSTTHSNPDEQTVTNLNSELTADESGCGEAIELGCARLLGDSRFSAGQATQFTIEYTVGQSGIPVGGGVSVGIHHAANWNTQTTSEDRVGFVTLLGENTQNLTLERIEYAPSDMFVTNRSGMRRDRVFRRVLIASPVSSDLKAGETIKFRFGAGSQGIVVPKFIDPNHEFRVTVDSDGQGTFQAIDNSPVFELSHGNAQDIAAFLPSQSTVGETVEVNIRIEDSYHNVAESWYGEVNIVDEQGNTVATSVPITSGTGSTFVSLPEGYHRLRLTSTLGNLSGRSNPVKVTVEAPVEKLYWADLHGHSSISDGLGLSADEYFRFGRDSSHLDINALTDHGQFDWEATIEAVQAYYAPGEYVTILAQEAGAGPDHMNIYYRRDDQNHIELWTRDYRTFLKRIKEQYNKRDVEAITAPHHFAYDRRFGGDEDYPFGAWDEDVARFIEVYSSHGTSEYYGNPRPLTRASTDERKYMQDALDKGVRFGVIAASDNHDSHPGRSVWGSYAGGLAGVWSRELTRESIWSSLHDYKTYGTSLDRIYVEFSIDGKRMGSDLEVNGQVSISAYVIGKTDNITVELIKNSQTIDTRTTTVGMIDMELVDTPLLGENHYYIRVTQDNGERAWSTPIWIERGY